MNNKQAHLPMGDALLCGEPAELSLPKGDALSLPKGWEIKKLGDVCELYQPKTISSKEMIDGGQYPVFGANGIIGMYDKYNHEESQLLITCRGATCGSVNISETKSWINGNAMVVRSKDNSLILKFIEYLFRGGIDISKTITGAAQPQITRQSLSPILISFPKSLPEQQRIVAKLDQIFVAIDKAKSNAEKNLKNAKELFESYLQEVFEKKGESWEEKTLGEVATFRNGMNFTKGSKGEEIKIVGVKDFKNSFWVPFENLESVIIDGKLSNIDLLNENDILVVRSNGNPALIGRTLLSGNFVGKVSHSGFTIRIRINTNILNPLYLCHYLKTNFTRKKLMESGTGVNIKSLNQGSLSSLLIKYPKSIETQQVIVQKLDALSVETKRLELLYQKKIVDLEELRKSVLQKAFNGEL